MVPLIVIEPIGGLGNQLFVYALGLANADRLQTSLVADLTRISSDAQRNFELDTFSSSLSDEELKPAPSKKSVGYKLHKFAQGGSGRYGNLYYERKSGFDERLLSVPDGARLRGYFQSWRYPLAVLDRLNAEVQSVVNPSELFKERYDELAKQTDWIAVHARFGDYKNLDHMHIASHYYRQSLSFLEAREKQLPIVVFSDEPARARKLPVWEGLTNLSFVGPAPHMKPIEHLLLMSSAPKIVTANSTFSWWAGYLARSPAQKVVFPRPWAADRDDVADFIPPGWFGVQSRF